MILTRIPQPGPEHARTLTTWLARTGNRFTPTAVREKVLSDALNRAFSNPIERGDLDFVRGKSIRIVARDIALDFSVCLTDNKFQLAVNPRRADVCFVSDWHSLLTIALGKVDPDTLFFRRELVIEGDTELGLNLKNFLDSQNPEDIIPPMAYRLGHYLAR